MRESVTASSGFPKEVRIREVGPREGIQTTSGSISTESKCKLITLLAATGVPEIEVTSFVRPDKVPSMADAEEIVSKLPQNTSVRFTALYLNPKGFVRGETAGRLSNDGWIQIAASDTFLRKNADTDRATSIAKIPEWCELFAAHGKKLHGVMVSTAFGCAYEGAISPDVVIELVSEVVKAAHDASQPLQEVCLADTVGMGNPESVRSLVKRMRALFPLIECSLHLHDTRGLGIANAYAGLLEGVRCFDASVGGVGGCPFTPNAAGNIATEDLVYLCHSLGVHTGISLEAYVAAARFAESIFGKSLPGHVYRVGPP